MFVVVAVVLLAQVQPSFDTVHGCELCTVYASSYCLSMCLGSRDTVSLPLLSSIHECHIVSTSNSG